MKKTVLAVAILFSLSFTTHAGIPVVDVAGLAQTISEGLLRAQEALQHFNQLKKEYEQQIKYAEEQKTRLEGFTDFSNGFDSASSYMKDSLSTITDNAKSDLSGLRGKYGLSSEDSDTQARYDGILQKIKFYDDMNVSMRERADRLSKLQRESANADTPQKKTDLANQLNTEKMTLDIQIKQFDLAERQMDAIEKAREEKYAKDFLNQITRVNS